MTVTPPPRRLVLLRHAKAEHGGALADELRPLSLEGRRQCAEVAAHLRSGAGLPERVLVSSAVRTRQTWELVRGALAGEPVPEVEVTDRLYDAGPGEVLDVVATVDERIRTLLVVGHEPAVSAVASYLAGAEGEAAHLGTVRAGLPTAGLAVLDVAGDWAALGPGAARLVDVLRPTPR
ncbi:SixA phosphatase family protein [Cellulomonas carbonis]|uniref:Phosphohistidine phosphatase n=1 Tax=Cellulomonas carbonis T26 TaxID=947969 RepID=A0A0A0BUZ4_9CELL|nr:histidine phosphatase family protein [Cellulomonas carbonis]KGM12208.1 phosphohistidine phosphatase [Cellulomonas carbonis T26]GGB96413.1 phosphoglycerate mutase [Cellulomonas carbonis]